MSFCPNCGFQNDDSAEFCGGCGKRLNPAKNGNMVFADNLKKTDKVGKQKKSNKKTNKGMIVLIVLLVILIAAGIGFYLFYQKVSSSSYAKEKYFTCLKEKKYDQAYEMLELKEGAWLTKNNFVAALKSSDADTKDIKVSRQSEKKWGFIPQWKVVPEGLLYEDMTVYVPNGASVKLNGIALDEYKKESEPGLSDNYVLPEIFKGTYTLQVDTEYCETIEKKIEVETYMFSDSVSIEEMELKETFLIEMKEKGKKLLEELYTAAINETGIKSLDDAYESKKILDSVYRSIVSDITYYGGSGTDLDAIELSGFEVESPAIYEEDGKLYLEISLLYDFESEWGDTDSAYSSFSEGYTETDFIFVMEEGEWKVHDLDLGDIH